jgi:hypothetical protein
MKIHQIAGLSIPVDDPLLDGRFSFVRHGSSASNASSIMSLTSHHR